MRAEIFLRAKIASDITVSGLVANRIFPLTRPEKSGLPAISYFKVSTQRNYNVNGDAFLSNSRFQIDCWADTYGKSLELGAAVINCLSGFYGTVSTSGSSGYFGFIQIASERQEFLEDINEYRNQIDVFLTFNE